MKTAVVAGGTGFIGSHLCDYLVGKGMRIICIDNMLTGKSANIGHLLGEKGFAFLRRDIVKKFSLTDGVDEVYHLASPASPVDYYRLPIETLLVNSVGTLNLLELACKKGARFLFASTSEVYGNPLEHPQRESYWGNVNSVGPRACYDEGKRFGEALVTSYARKFGLDARIARIFNTYGPRMKRDDGRVVSNFINQAIEGKPISVYGDGSQTRSFCYVSDMVEGLYKLMKSERANGEVVNLGSPNEITVMKLARLVRQITGSKSRIVFTELPEDDPERRKPDISKAKRLLGWEPSVSLHEGLKRTVEWYTKR